jgi:hypothetical protein
LSNVLPFVFSMERRNAARMMVDLPAWCVMGGFRHACRAIDLSTTGMVVQRTKNLALREPHQIGAYEFTLGESRSIRVRARPGRADGLLLAVRFVVVHDVDRLTIAEHADALAHTHGVFH